MIGAHLAGVCAPTPWVLDRLDYVMHDGKHAAQINELIEGFKKRRNIHLIIYSLKTCNVGYCYHDGDLRHWLMLWAASSFRLAGTYMFIFQALTVWLSKEYSVMDS